MNKFINEAGVECLVDPQWLTDEEAKKLKPLNSVEVPQVLQKAAAKEAAAKEAAAKEAAAKEAAAKEAAKPKGKALIDDLE